LISTVYSTPTKKTVDCDVLFQFLVNAASNPIPLPMVLSKMTVKSAIYFSVSYFPSDIFNQSPSSHVAIGADVSCEYERMKEL
jgi:hypothetical protein